MLLVILIIIVGTVLRFFPKVLAGDNLGVDHWYWKAYIETYKRNKQFPPVLTQYILDEFQWYPLYFPCL
jgi:hypothetical protein